MRIDNRVVLVIAGIAAAAFPRCSYAQLTADRQQAVDASIARALDYIRSEQLPDGCWRTDSSGESTAATSLAVMAFMAAGHVPDEGPYGRIIDAGVRWVVEHQEDNGMLVFRRSHGPMYSHGISTLMLAEALGMMPEGDAAPVRTALERAIRLILESQAVKKDRRHAGGWRYQTDSRDSDLSVTGWQVLALRAAKDVGCDVPAEAIDDAIEYIRNCSVRDNRGFGYQPGSGQTPTLTGVGITALEVCGEHHSPESLGGADWLLDHPLQEDSNYFFYGVYYTSVGMYKTGGEPAELYQSHLTDILLDTQDEDGSWLSRHGTERGAGRIYSTSMAILGLTVDYGYLPIYQR